LKGRRGALVISFAAAPELAARGCHDPPMRQKPLDPTQARLLFSRFHRDGSGTVFSSAKDRWTAKAPMSASRRSSPRNSICRRDRVAVGQGRHGRGVINQGGAKRQVSASPGGGKPMRNRPPARRGNCLLGLASKRLKAPVRESSS